MKPIGQLTPEELRVECAEAMGWKFNVRKEELWWTSDLRGGGSGMTRKLDYDEVFSIFSIPNYPADANAALTLAHALAEKGWRWVAMDVPEGVQFNFSRKKHGVLNYEEGDATATGPHAFALALCRAYLAVVRAGKERHAHSA